jgi:hypothetical protein
MNPVFFCPKPAAPSGGVWFIHKLVGLLRKMGKEAFVVTNEPFDVWWDANPLSKSYIKVASPKLAYTHTIVIPETSIHLTYRNVERKICFLQNHIWAEKIPEDGETIVCSRYLYNYTLDKYAKQKKIWKVTPYLEEDVWYSTEKIKEKVFMYSRRSSYSEYITSLLTERGFIVDHCTEPVSQRDAAKRLSDSEYYVHLSYPEGFPMACLEAMRSKALVVGTPGGGGDEFMFHKETAMCVQDPRFGRYEDSKEEFGRRILDDILSLREHEEAKTRMRDTAYQWSLQYNEKSTTSDLAQIGF